MKYITAQEAQALVDTHMVFWDSQIKDSTNKAYRVEFINQRGGREIKWLPKSRIKVLTVPITDAPGETRTRGKHFIPKFFTR